ncbi:MAG: hypothetical protein ACE5PV_25770, partial [Candidatus Poribacteria bacterium]
MPISRLIKFVELCKACGVTISPSESVDFTNDFAHIALEDKMLMEEVTVACLAKDNESEAIVRKLFRLFFTGRPEGKQEEESDADHVDSPLAHALREALESGELNFEQSEGTEASTETSWRRLPSLRSQPEQDAPHTNIPLEQFQNYPTEQSQNHPNIQVAPTHHPQMPDQVELERELSQFMHDNLSGRDLERIIELLEKLNAIQNAARLAENEQLEESQHTEQAENKDTGAAEDTDEEQLGELPTDADTMAEQGDQGTSPEEEAGNGESELSGQSQKNDDAPGAGDEIYPDEIESSLDMGPGVGELALGQSGKGEMGFMGRGNRSAAGSPRQNSRGNPVQRSANGFDPQNMENPNIPRFNIPLSLEAAQT